jgi:hypothetical protein
MRSLARWLLDVRVVAYLMGRRMYASGPGAHRWSTTASAQPAGRPGSPPADRQAGDSLTCGPRAPCTRASSRAVFFGAHVRSRAFFGAGGIKGERQVARLDQSRRGCARAGSVD